MQSTKSCWCASSVSAERSKEFAPPAGPRCGPIRKRGWRPPPPRHLRRRTLAAAALLAADAFHSDPCDRRYRPPARASISHRSEEQHRSSATHLSPGTLLFADLPTEINASSAIAPLLLSYTTSGLISTFCDLGTRSHQPPMLAIRCGTDRADVRCWCSAKSLKSALASQSAAALVRFHLAKGPQGSGAHL